MTSQESKNPEQRLSDEERADLKVVVADRLADDTIEAMTANFPAEQLPVWDYVRMRIEQGYVAVHELRSQSSGELLSSRMVVDYPARNRSEPQFLLVSFVVTPDHGGVPGSKRSKSKGYGSYLRQKSMEISRRQKPHALGLVAERESPKGVQVKSDQRVRRASWMSRIGLFEVNDFSYDIPPLVSADQLGKGYIPVAQRSGETKLADLLIYRFDGKDHIDGRALKSIISRLYTGGYGISPDDAFLDLALQKIDETRQYKLVNA